MKKTLFLLMALASVATAADTTTPPSSTFDFDFSDSLLSGASALRTVSFMDGNFRATITADDGTNTLSSGDWSTADGDDTGTRPAEGTPAYDYIKGGNKSTNLTLTLSNLVAGEKYSFSFTTGIPFEDTGAWNTISEGEGNTFTSRTRTPENASNPDKPDVRGITTFTYTDIVADSSGKISITIDTSADSHTPSFNVASLSGASKTATEGNLGCVFAASATQSGNAALIVREGSTGKNWAAAFGNAAEPGVDDSTLVLTGNASIKFTGDYTGGKYTDDNNKGTTVFGIVNAGKVTGNVNLVFDAANANYGSFTNTNAASVVGAYKGTIDGTFSATINSGTFANDIMGGIHTGDTDSIGATSLVIKGGTIGGNVYGGGVTGTIKGNTAVTIVGNSGLAALQGDILSAGGTGGSIGGNSTLTFSNIGTQDAPLSYAGSVEGASGATVAGSTTLEVDNSHLSLVTVKDFETINIAEGSSLTITGSLSGGSGIVVAYDADSTHIANKTNGLGNGIFDLSSYITGEGSFAMGEDATYNGLAVDSTDDRNLHVSNAIYYVTKANDTEYTGADANYTYVLSDEKSPKVSEVIHIGEYVGSQEISYSPIPDSVANAALAYYVEKGGTLAISGASKANGLSAGQMLVNTFGNGDIILRAQGYQKDVQHETTEIIISETTKATGNLYISPKVLLEGAASPNDIQPLKVLLEDGADISSFSSVTFGCQNGDLAINGLLGSDTQGHHINNLQLFGSGYNHIYINTDENEEIVLGGTTTLRSYKYYEPESQGHMGAQLRIVPNQSSTVRIEHLSSGTMDADTARAKTSLLIQSAYDQTYSHADVVNAVVHIDSFDFRGGVQINGSQVLTGTIDVNITLKDNQWISSDQYISPYPQFAKQKPSLTLKGTGTYILEDTKDIIINIGRLSTEVKDGDHLWQGTLQLSNVNATSDGASATGRGMDFAYYGNEQSTVDIQGFKGNVVKWSESGTVDTNQPESVEIVSALKLTDTNTMFAYEVTGGITTQNYTGSISGEGDFVVSATDGKNINLSGELKGWNGNLKATAGEQNVTLSGAATTVNAAIKAEGGSLNLTVDNSGKTTTFNKGIQVTALKVNDGSVAELTQESSAGNIAISTNGISTNGGNASLSAGITISGSMLSDGHIADAAITAVNTENTVELSNITAEDLYLHGEDAVFHSEESAASFYTEDVTAGDLAYTEVSFSSDIFKGMTLSEDGAKATITVSNTILDGGLIQSTDTNNVTIFLEGFTIEALNSSGVWNWDEQRLSFNVPEVATLSGEVTVQDLLAADYASVTYSQTESGLKIRMQNIPEPTTATLSLLALAGLAARRRRK